MKILVIAHYSLAGHTCKLFVTSTAKILNWKLALLIPKWFGYSARQIKNHKSSYPFFIVNVCLKLKALAIGLHFYDVYEALQNIPRVTTGLLNNSTQLPYRPL